MPPPGHSSACPAAPDAAPPPALPHRSTARQLPDDATTDASGVHHSAPVVPPLVRRSCAPRATTTPCSNSLMVCAGLHAPRRSPGHPCMPQSASLVGLARISVIPQNNTTLNCLFITQYY